MNKSIDEVLDKTAFGKTLKFVRKRVFNDSIKELLTRLKFNSGDNKISVRTYEGYESGRHFPSTKFLQRYLEVSQIAADQLFGRYVHRALLEPVYGIKLPASCSTDELVSLTLKHYFNERKLMPVTLADAMGTSPSTVRRWVRGEKTLSLSAVWGLSEFFGVPLDIFFGLTFPSSMLDLLRLFALTYEQ